MRDTFLLVSLLLLALPQTGGVPLLIGGDFGMVFYKTKARELNVLISGVGPYTVGGMALDNIHGKIYSTGVRWDSNDVAVDPKNKRIFEADDGIYVKNYGERGRGARIHNESQRNIGPIVYEPTTETIYMHDWEHRESDTTYTRIAALHVPINGSPTYRLLYDGLSGDKEVWNLDVDPDHGQLYWVESQCAVKGAPLDGSGDPYYIIDQDPGCDDEKQWWFGRLAYDGLTNALYYLSYLESGLAVVKADVNGTILDEISLADISDEFLIGYDNIEIPTNVCNGIFDESSGDWSNATKALTKPTNLEYNFAAVNNYGRCRYHSLTMTVTPKRVIYKIHHGNSIFPRWTDSYFSFFSYLKAIAWRFPSLKSISTVPERPLAIGCRPLENPDVFALNRTSEEGSTIFYVEVSGPGIRGEIWYNFYSNKERDIFFEFVHTVVEAKWLQIGLGCVEAN